MAKQKPKFVVYGRDAALMRATAKIIPSTSIAVHQNPRYFEAGKPVQGTARVIILLSDSERDQALAETIAETYVEAYGEDVILEVDRESLIEAEEAGVNVSVDLSRDLTQLKGLGRVTADKLIENGVKTVEELAAVEGDALTKLAEDTGIETLEDFVKKAVAAVGE